MIKNQVKARKILIVGYPEVTQVGYSLHQAALELGMSVIFCSSREAHNACFFLAKLNWWFRGHRPSHLADFSRQVVRAVEESRPDVVLATGFAPLDAGSLKKIGELKIRRINFLTDDPWNVSHKAEWFMRGLSLYDTVFSTRTANLDDLKGCGCKDVRYLSFAYDPALHYYESAAGAKEARDFESDVLFFGGADKDRVEYIRRLVRGRYKVALYGQYWGRFPEMRSFYRGMADIKTLRLAVRFAKVTLGFVRRANRDGQSMRSFEVAAMKGCMLTEDTPEHRQLFGEEGKAVVYFKSISEMSEKLDWLLEHESERGRLAQAAHAIVTEGKNTYKDRLVAMLR